MASHGLGRVVLRVDSTQQRTHGWHARVYALPVAAKPYTSKLFSDRRHGGKELARRAAIRWVKRAPRPKRVA